jgi:hypothetical protein
VACRKHAQSTFEDDLLLVRQLESELQRIALSFCQTVERAEKPKVLLEFAGLREWPMQNLIERLCDSASRTCASEPRAPRTASLTAANASACDCSSSFSIDSPDIGPIA